MIYLSGCTSPSYEQAIINMGVGLMIRPGTYAPKRAGVFPKWGADNGCASVVNGQVVPNPRWDPDAWGRFLGRLPQADLSLGLFVLVPDVPCDHERTLSRWHTFANEARRTTVPVAFAIQDGALERTVPWDEFDVAFLAGTTEWKLSRLAFNMACQARERGKWIHMGRVNSWERLDWASTIGCDSSDGTFMKHGKPADMVARLKVWLDNNSPRLFQQLAQVVP